MKKFIFLIVVLLAYSCKQQSADSDMDRFIDKLMSEMSIREKIGQLNLITPGGGIPTGSAVSTGVEEKIKSGQGCSSTFLCFAEKRGKYTTLEQKPGHCAVPYSNSILSQQGYMPKDENPILPLRREFSFFEIFSFPDN